jgi:anti-anti-sigma factor
MYLEIIRKNNVVKIHLKTVFLNVEVARSLKQAMMKLLTEDVNRIFLDFEKVKILDSISVGILVQSQTLCQQNDVKFTIINVSPDIMDIIRQINLDKILDINKYSDNFDNGDNKN